jgi:hypothetical protein
MHEEVKRMGESSETSNKKSILAAFRIFKLISDKIEKKLMKDLDTPLKVQNESRIFSLLYHRVNLCNSFIVYGSSGK